jgi:hypothetical protein
MIRIFLFILVWVLSLDAATWREMKDFNLKKDEIARVVIKLSSSPTLERVLSWRWTLYADKALVVHEKFDRIVGQHILYVGHNNGFRKSLFPSVASERDVPYAVVIFKKFDDQNKTAQFDLLIYDQEKRVLVEYSDKEAKK